MTTVVAGAGFGKSIAIGQAMRANRARPRGVEGWASCRAGCESPERLAASVEAAFGAAGRRPPRPARGLYAVFADQAPLHVSLVLDDVELLSDAGAALLDDLLRRAPSNLHLVLSGRRLPSLALARFRATDDVAEIDADALRFDEAEVAALAASLHAAPLERYLAGWPALSGSHSSPLRSVDEYLWEEVMRTLAPADREALLALCLLGASDVDEVEAVTGGPFDPDGFCARVPLVHRVGDRVVAHDRGPRTSTAWARRPRSPPRRSGFSTRWRRGAIRSPRVPWPSDSATAAPCAEPPWTSCAPPSGASPSTSPSPGRPRCGVAAGPRRPDRGRAAQLRAGPRPVRGRPARRPARRGRRPFPRVRRRPRRGGRPRSRHAGRRGEERRGPRRPRGSARAWPRTATSRAYGCS